MLYHYLYESLKNMKAKRNVGKVPGYEEDPWPLRGRDIWDKVGGNQTVRKI